MSTSRSHNVNHQDEESYSIAFCFHLPAGSLSVVTSFAMRDFLFKEIKHLKKKRSSQNMKQTLNFLPREKLKKDITIRIELQKN